MNILVIYDSTFGNTQQLAVIIARALKSYGTVQCVKASEVNIRDIQGTDLLILGSPTQSHGLPPSMHALIEALPDHTLEGLAVATFDTRYRMSSVFSGSSAQILASKLKKAGANLLLPAKSFFVVGREGPLEDEELERAEQWTRQIMERLELLKVQTAGKYRLNAHE
jgi:flavodoxin